MSPLLPLYVAIGHMLRPDSLAPAARIATAAFAIAALVACRSAPPSAGTSLGAAERQAIADTIRSRITTAANLSAGDVVASLMSLYPDTGRVISASSGRVITARDTLSLAIATFWRNIGQNMRDPHWEWGPMYIDVLAPDAAVLTATYSIPHTTPQGHPHVVGGAWTAVFQRRGGKWVIVQEHLSDHPAEPGL